MATTAVRRTSWRVACLVVATLAVACSGGDGSRTSEEGASDSPSTGSPVAGSPCPEGDPLEVAAGSKVRWTLDCEGTVNVTGSVSAHDLNGDGVDDPAIQVLDDDGEWRVSAFDGASGGHLWTSETTAPMITVAPAADLDGDDVADLLVAGRGVPDDDRPLVAISGRNGATLWRVEPLDPAWRNVYTPQAIGDVDDDDVADWVVVTSGDQLRGPDDPPTVAARLMAISGVDGSVSATVSLPAAQESYNSPIVLGAGSDATVLVGSGGEVFPGAFWRLPVASLLAEDPSGFQQLLDGGTSSFIAPASAGDIVGDGGSTVAVMRVDGVLSLLDPVTGEVRWQRSVPGAGTGGAGGDATVAVSYVAPALGQLDADPALEIVTMSTVMSAQQLASGSYLEGTAQVHVHDGATGELEHRRDVGATDTAASPLILAAGGRVGVVCGCVSVPPDPDAGRPGATRLGWWEPDSDLLIDLGLPLSETMTPAVGDADNPLLFSGGELSFGSTESRRTFTATQLVIDGAPVVAAPWGAYMGSDNTGRAEP
jgi:hypothetical protein